MSAGRRVTLRAAALAFMMCLTGCASPPDETFETTEKVAVTVEPARKGSIQDTLRVTGTIAPAAGAELMVATPAPARILEMPKAEGEIVRRGDLLVRFEIPTLDADVASKESEVARARARLEAARSAETRLDGLMSRGIAARREVEEARRERIEQEAALSEASSALTAATRLRGRQTVRAPFAGMVAKRWHNPGDLVESSSGDPILRLVDPSRLQVEISVPVADLPRVTLESRGEVIGPGSTAREEAVVRTGPAAVDPATGSAAIRLSFPAPTRFPVGTTVEVTVLGQEHKEAVLVPEQAVVREGAEAFVFTVDGDGHARRRVVQLGLIGKEGAEILKGVEAGEKVIVRGQESLPDGAAVDASGA